MKLKTILLTTLALATLNSCCLIDHSKTIKKIAEPMLNELDHFYKKNKRFPTLKERDEMLTTLGCKMKNNICIFHGNKIHVESQIMSDNGYDFNMKIIKEKFSKTIGNCGFSYYKNKTDGPVICFSEACLQIRQ